MQTLHMTIAKMTVSPLGSIGYCNLTVMLPFDVTYYHRWYHWLQLDRTWTVDAATARTKYHRRKLRDRGTFAPNLLDATYSIIGRLVPPSLKFSDKFARYLRRIPYQQRQVWPTFPCFWLQFWFSYLYLQSTTVISFAVNLMGIRQASTRPLLCPRCRNHVLTNLPQVCSRMPTGCRNDCVRAVVYWRYCSELSNARARDRSSSKFKHNRVNCCNVDHTHSVCFAIRWWLFEWGNIYPIFMFMCFVSFLSENKLIMTLTKNDL